MAVLTENMSGRKDIFYKILGYGSKLLAQNYYLFPFAHILNPQVNCKVLDDRDWVKLS